METHSGKTLAEIQFPVKLQNLFFGEKKDSKKKLYSGYKCLLNANTDHPISIVSNSYQIITHAQAYKLGLECMTKLFRVNQDEISVFKITSSSNCSIVFIDLLHKSYEINIWNEEVYVPYIRITNSYNKTRALRFDLGFVRKLCSNGCIFEQQTIQFNFPHTKKAIGNEIEFDLPPGKMEKFKTEFENYLNGIKNFTIDESQMFSLFLKAINYNISEIKKSNATIKRYNDLKTDAGRLLAKYEEVFGKSAYTVFNAATDYASTRLNKDKSTSIVTSGLQRKCGNWLIEFNAEKSKNNFSLNSYLGEFAEYKLN